MTPTREEIEKHIHDCADEQFYMDDGKTTQPRQKELGFLIDVATLALAGLKERGEAKYDQEALYGLYVEVCHKNDRLTAELEEANKKANALYEELWELKSQDVNRQTAIESALGEIDRLKAELEEARKALEGARKAMLLVPSDLFSGDGDENGDSDALQFDGAFRAVVKALTTPTKGE